MNYSTLTKTQKRCIDAFISIRPALASQASVTRTEVEELFAELHAMRKTGGAKIGYPMWLVKGDRVSRGQYKFPAPNATENDEHVKIKTAESEKTAEEDKEFFQDLEKYGIMEVA
jgi:hypothetical protein